MDAKLVSGTWEYVWLSDYIFSNYLRAEKIKNFSDRKNFVCKAWFQCAVIPFTAFDIFIFCLILLRTSVKTLKFLKIMIYDCSVKSTLLQEGFCYRGGLIFGVDLVGDLRDHHNRPPDSVLIDNGAGVPNLNFNWFWWWWLCRISIFNHLLWPSSNYYIASKTIHWLTCI